MRNRAGLKPGAASKHPASSRSNGSDEMQLHLAIFSCGNHVELKPWGQSLEFDTCQSWALMTSFCPSVLCSLLLCEGVFIICWSDLVGSQMPPTPQAHMFEHWLQSWWSCLGVCVVFTMWVTLAELLKVTSISSSGLSSQVPGQPWSKAPHAPTITDLSASNTGSSHVMDWSPLKQWAERNVSSSQLFLLGPFWFLSSGNYNLLTFFYQFVLDFRDWNSLGSPGCSYTYGNPSASSSWELRLQAYPVCPLILPSFFTVFQVSHIVTSL